MRCHDYVKLLHLNRPGELTATEKKSLEAHLEVCKRCQKKAREIKRTDVALAKLREIRPVLANREDLADSIITAIKTSPQSPAKRMLQSFIDRSVDFVGRYETRLALGVSVAVLMIAFFVQQIWILNRVTQLENVLANRQTVPEKYYAVESATLMKIWSPKELQALMASLFNKDLEATDEIIFVKRSTAKAWAQKLNKVQGNMSLDFFNQKVLRKNDHAWKQIFGRKEDLIKLFRKQYPNWRISQ
ncbi:MAG: anti-sigma factor family protein [bacterium]